MKTLTVVKNGTIFFSSQFDDISLENVHITDGSFPEENCPDGYSSRLIWDEEANELKYVYEKTDQQKLLDRIAELERMFIETQGA